LKGKYLKTAEIADCDTTSRLKRNAVSNEIIVPKVSNDYWGEVGILAVVAETEPNIATASEPDVEVRIKKSKDKKNEYYSPQVNS